MQAAPLTTEGFVQEFSQVIRVRFNWSRFIAEGWKLRHTVLMSSSDLGSCILPWYLGPGDREVLFNDVGARPVRVPQIPVVIGSLASTRQADVQRCVVDFRSRNRPVRIRVPAYAVSDDLAVVMDRAHRLAALALAAVPFRVDRIDVLGPLSADCLVDLATILNCLD